MMIEDNNDEIAAMVLDWLAPTIADASPPNGHQKTPTEESIMKSFAIASAVLALASSRRTAQISDDVVKIGVLTDMTGVTADITGKGSVIAAELAVQEFGGTVLDKPFRCFCPTISTRPISAPTSRGNGSMPTRSTPYSTSRTPPWRWPSRSLARDKKKIVLYSGAGTTALTNEQCSPYGFHWTYDTYAVSHGTASAVVKAGGTSWFILAPIMRSATSFRRTPPRSCRPTAARFSARCATRLIPPISPPSSCRPSHPAPR